MKLDPTAAACPPQRGGGRHGRLASVQYLRALAAIAVMVSHTLGDIAYHGGPDLFRYYYVGAAGVDLFFVISGFVMVYSARGLFGARLGWLVFLGKRLGRIVPLYWLATAVYALVQIGQGKWGVVRPDLVLASLAFWPYADAEGLHLPLYSIGWTLDVEMFFYAVFAAALPFRFPFGVAAILGGLGALVLAGTVAALPQPLGFWAQPILLDFLLGIGLGLALLRGWRMPRAWGWLAGALAAALLAGGTLAGFNAGPNVPEAFPRWIAWGIPAALLFAGTVLASHPPRPPRAWLVRLGDASYAVYLLHPLAIIAMRPLLPRLVALMGGTAGCLSHLSLVAVLVLAGSVALHASFEKPLMRRLSPAPRRPPPGLAAGSPLSGPAGRDACAPHPSHPGRR